MPKYTLEIDFTDERDGRHCLLCPVRNDDNDGCKMQVTNKIETCFKSWEEQMENCPLKLLNE